MFSFPSSTILLFFLFLLSIFSIRTTRSISLPGSDASYARFPTWNGCTNASFSFEFKSTQNESLLWYIDDGGTYDFFEIIMTGGRVRLVMNIVDGREGKVEVTVGNRVNDGRWHKVELRRRRMETFLTVDGVTDSRFSFGSDFHFGRGSNSPVFMGGLPSEFSQKLNELTLPSVVFQPPRFRGSFRNILYGNCTCQRQRGRMIDGVGVSEFPPEICDLRNPCRDGCICISTDTEPSCDCSELQCIAAVITHYELPMDRLYGKTLVNPSGLDATAFGQPQQLSRGIRGKAIECNGRDKYIQVSGPGHRYECFGDLDRCPNGYTLSFWVNFTDTSSSSSSSSTDGRFVYMSNGGHSSRNHGIAMLYDKSKMEFVFRKKNGDEWRATARDVLPGRWHHVAASWSQKDGLSIYLNGDLVETDTTPTKGPSVAINLTEFNNFIIGKPNDATLVAGLHSMMVDEFNFWSMQKNATEIRELGPFYRYYLPMNSRRELESNRWKMSVEGNPSQVAGKMGNALQFDGQRDSINGGDLGNSCLGNLSMCLYGFTTGMWMRFNDLMNNSYFLSTGKHGLELYYKDGNLTAEAQQGMKNWKTSWRGPETGRWYFVELTWNPDDGLQMFVDLKLVAESSRFQMIDVDAASSSSSNLYVSRANTDMRRERFASATYDDLELWYGDRDNLVYFDFIQRGKPPKEHLLMDSIIKSHVVHPKLKMQANGQTRINPGKINGALNLDGSNEFVSLGIQKDDCFGNLDLCRHGFLLSGWLKPGQLRDGMDIMSSGTNGLRVWYAGGKIKISARTSAKEWNLETDRIKTNEWQFLEVGWDEKDGLSLFINNEKITQASNPTDRVDTEGANPEGEKFYFGRGDGTRSNARYGNFTIDDVEYWSSNRDYLLAFDYIQRGKPDRILIDMDSIRGNRIQHPSMTIPVYGNPVNVPGKVNGAVRLDGNRQYADVGNHRSSCLGNAEFCNHGVTGSMFLNFRNFADDMYYMSSDGAAKVYYSDGKLFVAMDKSGKRWEVGVPYLEKDKWYFVEYTWHPEKGLQVFVNNKMAGERTLPVNVPKKEITGNVLIGSANPQDTATGRFRYADALVDEVETWYGSRDQLIAFDYLLRDNVTHIVFPLEQSRGSNVLHPDYTITMHNGATLVPGKVGNGALLEGSGEYLTFGDQRGSCMGNLEKCTHGITIGFYVKPKSLLNDAYILSAGPYSVYSKDGKLFAKFSTSNRTWEVSTDKVTIDDWQKVELSWDEDKGLSIYVDKEKVASTVDFTSHSPSRITDFNVYLGRPNEDNTHGRYAEAVVDELEYWFANRDHLKAFDLLDDEINRLIVDMDRIDGDILVHPTNVIYVSGDPKTRSGVIANSVNLDGRQQFVDVGEGVVCAGNLKNCPKGFTLRFKIRPNQLLENSYFVSSAPVDVFYQDGRLVAEVRTPNAVWRSSASNLRRDAWHQVDVSWHPVDGLAMYVNSELAGRQVSGTRFDGTYDERKHFYVGRANTNMIRERYANAAFDDLQIWEAKRDYLIPGLINPDEDNSLIKGQTPPPATTTTTTTTRRPSITIPPTIDKKWLMFDGRSWIRYDFGQLPDDYLRQNHQETFHVRFKTREPDALLWYTGEDDNNAHLTIKDGVLHLISNSGRSKDVFRVQVPSGRLDDDKWHDVFITKEEREVTMVVDGNEFHKRFISDVDLINPSYVYLAGSNDTRQLTKNHVVHNFRGTIEQAVMNGDTLPNELDLINMYLIKPRPSYIFVDGSGSIVELNPDRPTDAPATRPPETIPVTFTTGQAYVRLTPWEAQRSGSLEFNFQTLEPDGLILFNGGSGARNSDSFGVEIYDSVPYVNLDLGGGVQKYPFDTSRGSVSDGQPHHVTIERRGRYLRLVLDGEERLHNVVGGGDDSLDLGGFLYVGAIDSPDRVPWHTWTKDYKFFKGCFWGLKINGGAEIDLGTFVRDRTSPGIEMGCRAMRLECRTNPCVNGVCLERSAGHKCDCSATTYTGNRCQTVAPIAGFSGNEFVRIGLRPTHVTHTNDISVRFKTLKSDGLLFTTSSDSSNDYLRVLLENGRVKYDTRLGGVNWPLVFGCGQPLNDDRWHTLYIKRRANYLEAQVDNCTSESDFRSGEGYSLDIDEILVARSGHDDLAKNSFVGHVQNFYFDDMKFLEMIDGDRLPGVDIETKTNVSKEEKSLTVFPSTFRRHDDSYVVLPALQIVGNTAVRLTLKTNDKDGLVLFNEGTDGNFFAVEIVDGILRVLANDGSGPKVVTSTSPSIADNRWHTIDVEQTSAQNFNVLVDKTFRSDLTFARSRNTLDLSNVLHVGGVPPLLWPRLPSVVTSTKGFSGCLASFSINGQLYDLSNDGIGTTSQYITSGCTDARTFCTEDTCQHYGSCSEGLNTFICDCNMTSFVGTTCAGESNGYRYGWKDGTGMTSFQFSPQDTNVDRIAFGFMTWYSNGTLLRVESSTTPDYIDAKLVNGHVVVTYDIGDGTKTISEIRRTFNDGDYHYVSIVRNGGNVTLRVDDFPLQRQFTTGSTTTTFDDMHLAKIGGNLNDKKEIVDPFNGIIAGVYLNGFRIVDLGVVNRDGRVRIQNDAIQAGHPFFVAKPIPPTKPSVTELPPPVDGVGGGGGGWVAPGEGDEIVLIPDVGGAGEPVVGAQLGRPEGAGSGEGARAAAVAGAMLGILAAASSIMWAMYKFKPGLLGGGGGGRGGFLNISSPVSSTYQPVLTEMTPLNEGVAFRPSGTGGGAGTGGGNAFMQTSFISNGAASSTSAAAAGGRASHMATQTTGGTNMDDYYSFESALPEGAAGGGGGAAETRVIAVSGLKPGTMSQSVQTDLAYSDSMRRGGGGGMSSTTIRNTTTTNVYNVTGGGGAGAGAGGGYGATGQSSSSTQTLPPSYGPGYGDAFSSSAYSYESSRNLIGGGGSGTGGYSQVDGYRVGQAISPPPQSPTAFDSSNSSYQMRNMTLDYSSLNHQHQQQNAASSSSYGQSQRFGTTGLAAPNLMTSEEIRVDCVQLTNNGRYVVTGSIYGPPQVWDMKTGELVRIMQGEEFSSTDLHLANGDTLLVGQVAELEQVNPNSGNSTSNIHYRKLQIWDFNTGLPLEMRKNELCSASCLMNDGERMILGRTEKYGGGTTIIIWDVLGNEPLRHIKYDGCVGFVDQIGYLNLSKDNRYVIAGFQNSFDQNANFIAFDLTVDNFNAIPPKMIALNAQAEVTAVLENQEVVTGTRAGELIVWSMRTGKPLRQLVSPSSNRDGFGQTAHQREVKDVTMSKDGQFLVSASADGTLKVWSLQSEKLLRTLVGHTDQVCCCTVSNDNELIASGSNDCTIRLWRLEDGAPVAAINAGIDVFKVLLSNNKKTVVALADRFGARKLIMLQIVRTKVRSAGGSRATSPFVSDDPNRY